MTDQTWGADQPRPATVNVIIINDTGQGDIHLQSDPDAGGVPIIQDFIVQFDNNQGGVYSNGFLVSFFLPAEEGQNAEWTFDDDPIWAKFVDRHGACPCNKNDNDSSILTSPTLSQDKRALTVTNANCAKEYFGFALRFASKTTGKKLAYDPIGDNRNGSA